MAEALEQLPRTLVARALRRCAILRQVVAVVDVVQRLRRTTIQMARTLTTMVPREKTGSPAVNGGTYTLGLESKARYLVNRLTFLPYSFYLHSGINVENPDRPSGSSGTVRDILRKAAQYASCHSRMTTNDTAHWQSAIFIELLLHLQTQLPRVEARAAVVPSSALETPLAPMRSNLSSFQILMQWTPSPTNKRRPYATSLSGRTALALRTGRSCPTMIRKTRSFWMLSTAGESSPLSLGRTNGRTRD